jgi:hypothetical protein
MATPTSASSAAIPLTSSARDRPFERSVAAGEAARAGFGRPRRGVTSRTCTDTPSPPIAAAPGPARFAQKDPAAKPGNVLDVPRLRHAP